MSSSARTCPACGASSATELYGGIRDWEFGTPGVFAYVRCDGCGLVWLDPFPGLDVLAAAYPDDYVAFGATERRGLLYATMDRVRNALTQLSLGGVARGARVLDVGCGGGALLTRLRELGAREVHGVDFSARAAEICCDKGIEVFAGTFPEYTPTEADFDAIFMVNYIEHVLDPTEELNKAFELLRPGGTLLGELPNFGSIDRVMFGRFWGGNHCPRHTYQYDPQTLRACLARAGFEAIQVRQDINPGHLALSIQNWLQRNTDLANNLGLRFGRSWYLPLLVLALVPYGVMSALVGGAGNMKFQARRPE